MRPVLVNGRFLSAPQSGVQRSARELTMALDRVLAQRDTGEDWRIAIPRDAEVPKLDYIAPWQVDGTGGQFWEQVSLAWAARGCVLVNLANSAPLMHGRSVVLLHDAQVWDAPSSYGRAFRTWYALMHPLVARRAPVLATVSRHSAQRLTEHGVTRRSDIVVIGNGLDHILSTLADTSVADDLGSFVLTMGSAQPHKRTGFLLDIFADERLADVTLAVTGALPDSVAVSSNVRPLGPVSDEVLRGLFQKADLFLFPSQTEGFGLPPGEAILCGCAAVVSSGGALGEVYDGAARLLDQDDREAWICTIRALLDDPAARETLVAQGRARISGLTWEASAESLLDAMGAALGAGRGVDATPNRRLAVPRG